MSRPRVPLAVAEAKGRDTENPARFKNRSEPLVTEPLGDPPDWVVDKDTNLAREAWFEFAKIPWLNASHRILVASASSILGRLMAGQDVGVQALNLLRQCLGQMGLTPADASKVGVPAGDKPDDPADEFLA